MNERPKIIDPDFVEPNIWAEWLAALMSPSTFVHAGYELFNSFVATRPWRRLLVISPLLAVALASVVMIIWGKSLPRNTLVMRYASLAEAELKRLKAEEQPEKSEKPVMLVEEKTSPYSDMLYRRLLQLNDDNAHTRYLVAVQMARSQRISQARVLMEEIAPVGGKQKGYQPAHAWLAVDLLSRQPLSPDEQMRLKSHLQAIADWDGAGSGLLAIGANVAASEGKRTEAVELMGKAAAKDPTLHSAHAILARRLNMPRVANDAADKARQRLLKAVEEPTPKLEDFVQLASLELAENKFEDALQVAQNGLKKLGNDHDELHYLASEALRYLYRQSMQKTPTGVQFKLNLLDMAMKEFPANPNLAMEVALLEDMGIEAPQEFKKLMEQQLANGQASALAHLILANQHLKAKRTAEAIPHLELTLKTAPRSPIALNNLALALALTDTTQLPRASELIDRAISIDPRNPELYDSQGQIRMIAEQPLDAIESFEKALSINPNRIGTREQIVQAYRKANLKDLADRQEEMIKTLKAQQEKQTQAAEKKPVVKEGEESPTPDGSNEPK